MKVEQMYVECVQYCVIIVPIVIMVVNPSDFALSSLGSVPSKGHDVLVLFVTLNDLNTCITLHPKASNEAM